MGMALVPGRFLDLARCLNHLLDRVEQVIHLAGLHENLIDSRFFDFPVLSFRAW